MNKIVTYLVIITVSYYPINGYSQADVREISPERMTKILDCKAYKSQIEVKTVQIEPSDSALTSKSKSYTDWNLSLGGSWGNGKAAFVIFAIIGIVVIVAVIPYALKYLYDVVYGENPCYNHYIGFTGLALHSETGETSISGHLIALNYTVHIDYFESTGIGLTAELGTQRLVASDRTNFVNSTFEESGLYGIVGPKLYFARNLPDPSHGYFQILAGSSFNPRIGNLAKAELGLNLLYGQNHDFGFGFGFGSLYSRIEPEQGILKDIDSYSLYFSTSLLFSF